jgi:short-subunit dehydrogenase
VFAEPVHLNGKVAAITGGSGGIGRAAALCLGKHGATVAICVRLEGVLRKTAAEIKNPGVGALPIIADAASYVTGTCSNVDGVLSSVLWQEKAARNGEGS